MPDGLNKPQRWLIAVAAVVLAIFLLDTFGSWSAVALFALAVGALLAFQQYRRRRPASPPSIRCLKCGETLKPSARNCNFCGSASWTFRN